MRSSCGPGAPTNAAHRRPWLHDVVGGTYMRFIAPGAYRAWKLRPGQQALEDGVIAGMGTAACQIHPPAGSPDISSVETDPGILARGMEIGRRVVAELFAEFGCVHGAASGSAEPAPS